MEHSAKRKLDNLMKHQTSNQSILKKNRGEECFRKAPKENVFETRSRLAKELKIKDRKKNIDINEDSEDDARRSRDEFETTGIAKGGSDIKLDTFRNSSMSGDKMSNSFRMRSGSKKNKGARDKDGAHYQRSTWYG